MPGGKACRGADWLRRKLQEQPTEQTALIIPPELPVVETPAVTSGARQHHAPTNLPDEQFVFYFAQSHRSKVMHLPTRAGYVRHRMAEDRGRHYKSSWHYVVQLTGVRGHVISGEMLASEAAKLEAVNPSEFCHGRPITEHVVYAGNRVGQLFFSEQEELLCMVVAPHFETLSKQQANSSIETSRYHCALFEDWLEHGFNFGTLPIREECVTAEWLDTHVGSSVHQASLMDLPSDAPGAMKQDLHRAQTKVRSMLRRLTEVKYTTLVKAAKAALRSGDKSGDKSHKSHKSSTEPNGAEPPRPSKRTRVDPGKQSQHSLKPSQHSGFTVVQPQRPTAQSGLDTHLSLSKEEYVAECQQLCDQWNVPLTSEQCVELYTKQSELLAAVIEGHEFRQKQLYETRRYIQTTFEARMKMQVQPHDALKQHLQNLPVDQKQQYMQQLASTQHQCAELMSALQAEPAAPETYTATHSSPYPTLQVSSEQLQMEPY